ncbi:MAG: hypothetical protein ACR2NA_13050 [Solirubrobacterales bacterium]
MAESRVTRPWRRRLSLVAACVLGAWAMAVGPAAAQFSQVFDDYRGDQTVSPCRYSAGQLNGALGGVPPDIEAYAPNFVDEVNRALERQGRCGGGSSGGSGGSGTSSGSAGAGGGSQAGDDSGSGGPGGADDGGDGTSSAGGTGGGSGSDGSLGGSTSRVDPGPAAAPPGLAIEPAVADGAAIPAPALGAERSMPLALALLALLVACVVLATAVVYGRRTFGSGRGSGDGGSPAPAEEPPTLVHEPGPAAA